ncbi:MAG: 30S ribosomal protein S19e [Promethearchaeota archaeon]
MVTVYDVYANDLIEKVSEKLKEFPGIKAPEQLKFWKTASFKEISPIDSENFWYIRCASLLRKLYIRKNVGVNKLRKEYGGRSRNNVHKKHFVRASGAIIRRCLQQLEATSLVKISEGKGRILTPSGISLLDKTALEIYKGAPIKHFTHLGIEEE